MTPQRPPKKLPPRRSFFARTWLMWVILLVAGAGGGAYYYYNYATMASAEVAKVKRGTAITSVYGTVSVDPVEQIIVRSRNNAQLSVWKVKQGDAVKKGQALVEMVDDSILRSLTAAQANLAQAKTHQSLGPADAAALKNQEIEVEKIRKLVAANNLAQVELDKALNLLKQLQDQVKNEGLALDNEVDTLQRQVDTVQAQVNENTIISPLDGIVLNTYANIGEFLPPQTQLCRIGSAANKITATVNEEDIGDLKGGMKAKIRLYAFPNADIAGTLLYIGTVATNQAYPVAFSLDDPTLKVLPGMTGEMNVIIGEHKDVLTIPTRAIRHGDSVLTVEDGVVRQAHVGVGFKTLETSEITSGLAEGVEVILSNQDNYKPGMRVRELNEKDE